jgi:hypothetical protein
MDSKASSNGRPRTSEPGRSETGYVRKVKITQNIASAPTCSSIREILRLFVSCIPEDASILIVSEESAVKSVVLKQSALRRFVGLEKPQKVGFLIYPYIWKCHAACAQMWGAARTSLEFGQFYPTNLCRPKQSSAGEKSRWLGGQTSERSTLIRDHPL